MQSYINELENLFRKNSNSENAFFMKKYMKDKFEFLGIKSPLRRELSRSFLQKSNLPPFSSIIDITTQLWNKPEREFQYFAQELLSKYLQQFDQYFTKYLEHLITNKSWWDTVDYIASNLVGPHFQNHEELLKPMSKMWCDSDNMWLQRTSLLFQLKYKDQTDTTILFNYIQKHVNSKEFFIRKAIGWALREYAKTDPKSVIKFVDANALSGLSRREALKNINNI